MADKIPRMIQKKILPLSFSVVLVATAFAARAQNASNTKGSASGVTLTQLEDRLRVEIGGQLFTEYFFKDVPRPYCYPVIGPGGAPMSRNWPMKDVANEAHDHNHHRSLWYAHGDINGVDFWSEGKGHGKTVHEKFTQIKSGQDVGWFTALDKWVAPDGKTVCTGERTLRFHSDRRIDFDVTVKASQGPVTFGDTKEGSMSIRLNESMRLTQPPAKGERKTKPGEGHIVTSAGILDDKTWGTRADWVDYYGPVNGKVVGVAIFDHPQNPRHPTWWHVRDYGLFAANPFGIHDFERNPDKTKGNLVVPAGQSVTFRYRFYFHEGDEKQGHVAERYQDYARAANSSNSGK